MVGFGLPERVNPSEQVIGELFDALWVAAFSPLAIQSNHRRYSRGLGVLCTKRNPTLAQLGHYLISVDGPWGVRLQYINDGWLDHAPAPPQLRRTRWLKLRRPAGRVKLDRYALPTGRQ